MSWPTNSSSPRGRRAVLTCSSSPLDAVGATSRSPTGAPGPGASHGSLSSRSSAVWLIASPGALAARVLSAEVLRHDVLNADDVLAGGQELIDAALRVGSLDAHDDQERDGIVAHLFGFGSADHSRWRF